MKRFWNWLLPPPRKLFLIRRFSSRLTMEEFRSSKELVGTAKKFLMDPEFQPMLEVLRNESPAGIVAFDPRMTIEARAVLQARIEGYHMAIENLFAMGVHQEPEKPLEANFEQPENEMP